MQDWVLRLGPYPNQNPIISFADAKGQLISKKNFKTRILPKNERINSFLLVCDVFSFVFWENPRQEKNVSRLSDL